MFILTILEKIKQKRLNFSQGSVTLLEKMVNYQEVKSKLTNTQLNKFKSPGKNKKGTILRIHKRNFQDEELAHELILTTRQIIKIRNVFDRNMSTDIKLSKYQISNFLKEV